MTATNHLVTGAVIALAVKQPVLAPALALASHFVCDAIPHFDPKTNRLAKITTPLDLLIAGILFLWLGFFADYAISRWVVIACMFLATIPDSVWGWRFFKAGDVKKMLQGPMLPITRFHQKIQWSETRLGILVELPWFALMAILFNALK